MATAFDFPASPTVGQTTTLSGGDVVEWRGDAWIAVVPGGGGGGGGIDLSDYALKSASIREVFTGDVNVTAADENGVIMLYHDVPVNVQMCMQATEPYEAGRSTLIVLKGNGPATLTTEVGVDHLINAAFSMVLSAPGAEVSVTKTAANSWIVAGDLAPV